jgi:hypothetical protein
MLQSLNRSSNISQLGCKVMLVTAYPRASGNYQSRPPGFLAILCNFSVWFEVNADRWTDAADRFRHQRRKPDPIGTGVAGLPMPAAMDAMSPSCSRAFWMLTTNATAPILRRRRHQRPSNRAGGSGRRTCAVSRPNGRSVRSPWFNLAVLDAKIELAHRTGFPQFGDRPLGFDPPPVHEVAAIRHREGQPGVLLDQQH